MSTQEASSVSGGSLGEKLVNSKRASFYPCGSDYVPIADIVALVGPTAIAEQAPSCSLTPSLHPTAVAGRTQGWKWRVYAIAAAIQMTDRLDTLLEAISDDDLPVSLHESQSAQLTTRTGRQTSTPNWTPGLATAFVQAQWSFIAPVFDKRGQHLSLHYDTILPVPWQAGNKQDTRKGWVVPVAIDRSHVRMPVESLRSPPSNNYPELSQVPPRTVVCLMKCPAEPKSFERERRFLTSCNERWHEHVNPLLFSFDWRSQCYLIFPLAICDMRAFLANGSNVPNDNTRTVAWAGSQTRGLTDAVDFIHHDLRLDGQPALGLHGDISATNVLVFEESNGDINLKLADFACSTLALDLVLLSRRSLRGIIGTWQPPERFLEQPPSQKIDVWGLGCLFLELTVWLLRGPQQLEAFREARVQKDYGNGFEFTNDYFFALSSPISVGDPTQRKISELNPAVVQTIADLHIDTASPILQNLLDVLENGMLAVDPNQRFSSRQSLQKLTELPSDE